MTQTKKVAVFLEMAGINKEGIATGPYAGGKAFIKAVRAHSKHDVTFFSTKVTDPELTSEIDRTSYFGMSDTDLEKTLAGFDAVHVLNGKKTALRIARVTGQAILGPNVVFSIPYRDINQLKPEVRTEKAELLAEEQAVCDQNWSYLLTPNPRLEPLLQHRFRGKHGAVIAMPYCVDTQRFNPDPKAIRDEIVWVGGGPNRPGKGGDLIEEVKAALPKEKWVLFGKDSLFKYGDQIPHLQKAKIYVVTTAHETQGLATFEAMACGAPVVIANYKFDNHDGRGYREQTPPYHIDGTTSRIVSRNAESIVAGIESLLRNPAERDTLSKRSLSYVRERFSPEAMIKQYDAIIKRRAEEQQTNTEFNEKAKQFRDTGKLVESIQHYELLVQSEPFSPHPLYFLGTAHMYKGDNKTAEAYFKKVLELAPGHSSAKSLLEKIRGEN